MNIFTADVPHSKVSFGTTLNREVYPTHVPHTRFGNDMIAIKGQPNTGPGAYNNEQVRVE